MYLKCGESTVNTFRGRTTVFLTQNMSTCTICNLPILDEDLVKCTGICERTMHFYCAGFSEKSFRAVKCGSKKFLCGKCISEPKTTSRTRADPVIASSEVNSGADDQSDSDQKENEAILDDQSILTKQENFSLMTAFQEVQKQNLDLKKFIENKFDEYSKNLEFHASIVKELTTTVKTLESEIKDLKIKHTESEKENSLLRVEIETLKDDVIQLQQYSRRKNIEISQYPETQNEDITKTVNDIFKKLDPAFDTDSIAITHRIPTARQDKDKPIIVQFKSKAQRDHCLQLSKVKKLLSSDFSTSFPTSPVYFNEHLAPAMKKLLNVCKIFKRENEYKYCWVKDGKIFLRKADNSKVFRVTNSRDLSKLNGDCL